jgi:colanic acid/amylovoran biosynthesis glycosyltransferase
MSESSLCIIKGHVPLISETFIDTHIQRLRGHNVVLYNYFPEYVFNGRQIRYFYSRRPLLRRLRRLLPMFMFDRVVTLRQHDAEHIHDFLAGFFRSHNVGCILAEYGTNGADITPTARRLGLPLVVHFHGHDAHREPDLIPYADKYPAMFRYARSIVSVSRLMTQKLLQMGAPEEKIVYNPYGAREYFFNVQPDYGPTLLAVGRFADIKAPYLTIAAFREIAPRYPDARLVMVGDGPLLECCKSLAITWGIKDRIVFTGPLTHDQFLPLMAKARAFVQHSVTTTYGDAEGTPNSVLEAQAAGLPVISTRHAGICEAVIHGTTGFLCAERDIEATAIAMARFLENESLAREMGAAAREHIRTNYSIDRHISTLQQTLDDAAST